MNTAHTDLFVLEGVQKNYGDLQALRGVDLRINSGDLVALLGRNGAGKSTLISIAAGILRADAGTVTLAGQPITTRQATVKHLIGIAPQNTSVYPTLTVRQNLRYFGELAGLRRVEMRRRIEEVGTVLALWDLRDRPARNLSAGEQRRLHTAMAFMHRPRLLLLDEPTMAADAQSREQLVAVVRRLAEDGSAVCYSTHNFEEVVRLGASVAILESGTLIAQGSVASLISEHGESAVDMHFDGPAPRLIERMATTQGKRVRVASNAEPAEELASILAELGQSAQRLKSIELVGPSLESVFLKLTDSGPTNATPI